MKARRWPASFEFQVRPFSLLPASTSFFSIIIIILLCRRAPSHRYTCSRMLVPLPLEILMAGATTPTGWFFSHCSSPLLPLCLSNLFLSIRMSLNQQPRDRDERLKFEKIPSTLSDWIPTTVSIKSLFPLDYNSRLPVKLVDLWVCVAASS